MKSKVIIWSQEGCELCEKAKDYFAENGYEERQAEDLIGGNMRDIEAMSQLAMQNMQLPVIKVDDKFVNISDIARNGRDSAA